MALRHDPWPEADSVIFDPLGGRPMLELMANARSFKSYIEKVKMPDNKTLDIFRASFDMDNGRLFLFTYSYWGDLHCVSFENRPQYKTWQGVVLSALMAFNPRITTFRNCYVLPCSPSDLTSDDLKKVFRMLTHIELDLW